MSLLEALIAVLAISMLMLVVLATLVVGRKIARDRSEARSVDRRDLFARVVLDARLAELEDLAADVAGDAGAQVDLLAVLARLGPQLDEAARSCLVAAARGSGLAESLVAGVSGRDAVGRGRCGLLLARLGMPEAPDHLRALLRDPDPDVRLVACAGLGLSASPRAVSAMVDALRVGELPAERLVERLGAPWAVDALLGVLAAERATPGPVAVRAHVARALGLAGDRAAAPALVALLCTGTTEERISAARALGDAGGPESVGALVVALEDEEWPVRVQAARALGALGATDQAAALGELLADGAWWVRAAAADALSLLGAAGVEVLRGALDHPDRYARDRAREQLALLAMTPGEEASAPSPPPTAGREPAPAPSPPSTAGREPVAA